MKKHRCVMRWHVNPHAILVGYSGKIGWDDRLLPLRMTRKYNNFLKREESEKNEKILQMSQLIEKYQNLSCLIDNLRKENENDENSSFLLELQGEKKRYIERLLFLESELDHELPDVLNTSMQVIFSRNAKHSKNRSPPQWKKTSYVNKKRVLTGQNCKESLSNSLPEKKPNENFGRKFTNSSMFGSVKSQILVKDQFSNLHKINIDLFSNGENLVQVLATELGEELEKNCNITFGTKKVEKEKSLYEQGIYHGSTVNLDLKLHGGAKSKKKKQKKKESNMLSVKSKDNIPADNNPESWTRAQVKDWFANICKDLDIEEEKVSQLTSMNGKGLNLLLKEEWLRRSPDLGDFLFRKWNDLKKEHSNEQISGADTKEEKNSALEEKAPISEELQNAGAEVVNDSLTKGPFGKVDNLSDIGDSTSLYKLITDGDIATLKPGHIITMSGICRKKPERVGELVTFPFGDDPPGAACPLNQNEEVKVEVRTKNENQDLNPETVDDLLMKINKDTPVAVRGRVEILDLKTSKFKLKLVVDADRHGLVYQRNSTGALYSSTVVNRSQQRSQPWYIEMGIYPCVVDEKSLDVGGIIEKTNDRIFCNFAASDSEIKKIAAAFKNSSGGDIFVGVEGGGKVTGMEFTQGEVVKWREKISSTIAQILPESEISICSSEEEASQNIGNKSLVSVMKLGNSVARDVEKVRVIARIHVTKGTDRVYFSKQSDVHAYVRVGAETKRITDYSDLFSRLDSLRTRTIQPIADEDSYTDKQLKEAMRDSQPESKYNVFKELKFETQNREFKMIFGDKPVEIIENRYLAQYTCGFLNSSGGSILFGVQEDERSKVGLVVGIVIPPKEREELVRKSITVLSTFYPPVSTSQFRIKFYKVILPLELIVKYPKTGTDESGKCVLLRGPADEIGMKWPKFIKDKLPGTHCRVIRVKSECFCIVVEKPNSDTEQVMPEIVKEFAERNSKVNLDSMEKRELKPVLKNICVVELLVNRSPYPIHMIKPIETFVVDDGELRPLSQDKLMYRFEMDSKSVFDVKKFLNHVEHFEPAGNSYVLIACPFNLPKVERDLYGLVIPEWTLTIDFDQDLQHEGHLYQIFSDLNDLHQTERNRFVRTPSDHKLDLNPENGVCWLAARGYKELDSSLSKESHGNWNMTHRAPLRTLLEADLTSCLKLNRLNVVVLWDEKYNAIINSLRMVLEDILSIHGDRTTVTFVCSTSEAKSDISEKLVKPLEETYWEIMEEDRIYEAPPYVLAQHLSCNLPAPYRPDDDYQVPHQKCYRGKSYTVPATLPQRLRQNIKGHLKMMYMTRERKPDGTVLKKERKQFYSGSEITELGLHCEIGIKRSKMVDLEEGFKFLSSDIHSRVSLILVEADRGAGTTTMCLQFLFQHHKEYPCAQLTEIREGLAGYIENITKATKLPLVLLVDEEVAHLQDFLDLKKELEARHIHVIFLLIEPAEVFCRKQPTSPHTKSGNPRMKGTRENVLYGTSSHKKVKLRRDLEDKEMEELMKELIAIDESKRVKLTKLKAKCEQKKMLRTFAHFSLTAFGNEFSGLPKYVQFRLNLADDNQKTILAFLSLTHVFTDYLFPVSALARFLDKKKVVLENEFENSYLRELLSPRLDENDSRRMSFHEVAQEILAQLAAKFTCGNNENKYWAFIKHVSVEMAKKVLSDNIRTKQIDRLSTKLFVTSEYESEKFSFLIRYMKEDGGKDTARDTLIELVKVFQQPTSFRAHLLAHLAKYYMTIYDKFAEAKPLIEEAIKDQEDDVLLHHIHGDIIRRYVKLLKNKKNVDLNGIIINAIESSECFEIVRNKRPHMSHGYVSDAMVRITVMQAARKKMEKKDASFVDYLIQMIDNLQEKGDEISTNERYLLSLIPDAHQYLEDSAVDFEHKEKWKEKFIGCIGELSNLKKLYEKLRDEKDCISDWSGWLFEVTVETQLLYNALNIETKDLTPEELEEMIKGIDECSMLSKSGERTMRTWIRYSRFGKSVPPLEEIRKKIKQWVAKGKKRGGVSPHAEFYNYVINVLIALKDPNDQEKMDFAKKLVKRQQGRKFNKKEEGVLPYEWLHCKTGHHIDSIDSLLHNDDLLKETSKSSGRREQKHRRREQKHGREAIEGSLFEKQITKWEGKVKEVRPDGWYGTIVFKDHFEVRFVPCSVKPSMPSTGDGVRFYLAFDRYGLSAWSVVRECEYNQPKGLSELASSDEGSSSENNEDEQDSENEVMVPPSLFTLEISEERLEKGEELKCWEDYIGQHMQGVVISTNVEKGFGFLQHPDLREDKLFFHASQLVKPVKSLKGTISKYMTLDFTVEKIPKKTRAANIKIVENEDVSPVFQDFLSRLREEQRSTASSSRRENEQRENEPSIPVESREEGLILRWREDKDFGFIKSDNSSHRDIFFHRKSLVKKGTEFRIGDRVLFRLSKTKKGLEASDVLVQSQNSSNKKWDHFVDHGIQEGFVKSTTNIGGLINNRTVGGGKDNLPFYYKDISNANQFTVVDGAKVHFEVKKRGGKCIAVKINIISVPQPMLHQEMGILGANQAGFLPHFPSTFPYSQPLYFSSPYFENQPDDGDRMDEDP